MRFLARDFLCHCRFALLRGEDLTEANLTEASGAVSCSAVRFLPCGGVWA